MAKRSKLVKIEVFDKCMDCVFCEPYTKRFLNYKGKPILRACRYEKYLAFLDRRACNKFKKQQSKIS